MINNIYFRSSQNEVDKAINRINHKLNTEMYVSLNELYIELHIDRVNDGDYIGWNIDGGLLEPYPIPCIAPNGEPCIELSMDDRVPISKYDQLY